MTHSTVATIRRLALLGFLTVTVVITATYGLRRWRVEQARSEAPQAIPQDVQQQSELFTFSRSEAGRTLFTVEAARAIEREGQTTVLEDVHVLIRGQRGDRRDEIHTPRCDYDQSGSGRIFCPGEVNIRLGRGGQGPDEAQEFLRLTTTAIYFDPEPGVAWTDEPVRFSFPKGEGEAVGLRYQPRDPQVRLASRVVIRVGETAEGPVRIRGAQLHFYSARHYFDLIPPLRLEQGNRSLTADSVRMELDRDFHTQQIVAQGAVEVRGQQDGRQLALQADSALALYAADGHVRRLQAAGAPLVFTRESAESSDRLTCREAVLDFDAAHRSVERVTATGAAEMVSRSGQSARTLRAPEMELALAPRASEAQQLLTARRRATLILEPEAGRRRTIVADQIQLAFEQQKWLRALTASGGVETEERRADGRQRKTRSAQLRSQFDDDGRLLEAEQWGGFHYEDERWQARAGRADYGRATGSVVLRQQPVVWDATSRTRARVIEVDEQTGKVRAEGDVRTTQRPSKEGPKGFGSSQPVTLAAERMRADPERGWARYQGHARMWQGESRLAAGAIELFQDERRLEAEENVAAVFVEQAADGQDAARRPVQVTAQRFTYLEADRRGVFREDVKAWNDFGTLTAPLLRIFLAGGESLSSDRLERAYAEGGVLIRRLGREARSEEAEYKASEGTVVLWGGAPTILDPARGTTSGARLTLFLADGTIVVDSAEGTRTVTRHRARQ